MFDDKVREIIKNINMLVPWYLITSYLYYERDVSVISDGLYDEICSLLKENFNEINHIHKERVLFENLSAGTALGTDYPEIVKSVALRFESGAPVVFDKSTSNEKKQVEPELQGLELFF